ncbi:MAG: AraC family transcriptional regulator [Halomonadaceae bacterium]|nr:MAG: AraC family transcriptional regulator [Halomonadaceae bacterium]
MLTNKSHLHSGFAEPLLTYLQERHLQAPALEQQLREALTTPGLCAATFCQWLEALYQLDPVPALGLRLGTMVEPRHFGAVGYLMLSCRNLGQGLTRYRRFHSLMQTGLRSWVVTEGDRLHLNWTQPVAKSLLAHEYSVACFINLYQALIGRNTPPISASFPDPKPHGIELYEAALGCPVHFNAPSLAVELPTRLMAMGISSSDAHLQRLLERQALAMLQKPETTDPDSDAFLGQLQTEVMKTLKDGDCSAAAVARNLGYSLRSFYRKLSGSGYSYRSLLADTRLRLAKYYLADPTLSLTEVALLLGYAEQSSFSRPFRIWMGITPGEYREQLAAKQQQRGAENLPS